MKMHPQSKKKDHSAEDRKKGPLPSSEACSEPQQDQAVQSPGGAAEETLDAVALQADLEALSEANKALEETVRQAEDRYLRLAAEYENYRKRSLREKENIQSDLLLSVMRDFLPLYDNLDRALLTLPAQASEHESERAMAEGMRLLAKQAGEILQKLGVEEMQALGQPFDPNRHDAVLHEEREDVGPNQVTEVLMKGYSVGDRVIRHAMVKVAN